MDKNEPVQIKEIDKEIDWVYYHLIALEYVESKFEAARQETGRLTDASNKDPDKYKKAYKRLLYITDKAQKLIRNHAEKAMEHSEKTLPKERIAKIQVKRRAENKCYERIFITKPDMEYNVGFNSADQMK